MNNSEVTTIQLLSTNYVSPFFLFLAGPNKIVWSTGIFISKSGLQVIKTTLQPDFFIYCNVLKPLPVKYPLTVKIMATLSLVNSLAHSNWREDPYKPL